MVAVIEPIVKGMHLHFPAVPDVEASFTRHHSRKRLASLASLSRSVIARGVSGQKIREGSLE